MPVLKIATWNVNSIRARHKRFFAWLEKAKPDIALLQETKVVDLDFPSLDLTNAGYRSLTWGEASYNGVAIVWREALGEAECVRRGLSGSDEPVSDDQARLIGARIAGLWLYSVYLPNGGEMESDKWRFKLDWIERFTAFVAEHHSPDEPVVFGGDYNIVPDDIDAARPLDWQGTVLFNRKLRRAFQRWIDWGLVDLFREIDKEPGRYSWWDYRRLAFPKGDGLRIDHLLGTRTVADRLAAAMIDRDERKGEKPSDHAPVLIELRDEA